MCLEKKHTLLLDVKICSKALLLLDVEDGAEIVGGDVIVSVEIAVAHTKLVVDGV